MLRLDLRRDLILIGALLVSVLLTYRSPAPVALAAPSALSQDDFRQILLDHEVISLTPPRTLRTADVRPADLVSGTATVTFAAGVSAREARALIAEMGGQVTFTIPELNVYQVDLPAGWTVDAGIAALSALPGAERSEPVVRSHEDFHPNDPLYDSYQPYLSAIHVDQGWDIQQGDRKIVVAVLDSGIDITHPDLVDQIWTNPNPGHSGCGNDVHGCNFVDPRYLDTSCEGDATPIPNPDIRPNHWHGTFVAGVIGAATNNGIGVAGIVPRASIMAVKVGDCNAELVSPGIASAYLYATNNGARVINYSAGASECRQVPSYELEAINQALSRGVVITVSAGNDGLDCVGAPANTYGVMAVGALSSFYDRRAFFSNWGPQISVVAPGWNIMSTTPQRTGQSPFDFYRISAGTSFSSPMVAGLADLLLSQNPLLTGVQVRALIERGATPLPPGREPGWAGAGRIDISASLKLVPAAFYGRVAIDGAPVPAGTVVEARIGRTVCGQAFSTIRDGQSVYALTVASAAEQANCGTPGAPVVITVNGVITATIEWKGAGVQLDLGTGAASSAPQPAAGAASEASQPGAGVAARGAGRLYPAGWNLVGAPGGTVFAGAQGSLFTLQAGDEGYESLPVSGAGRSGLGYWAYFPRDTSVAFAPDGPAELSIPAPPGKYIMVGNPSGTHPVTVGGADSVLVFDAVKGSYSETPTLQPGQGAFVLSLAGGTITVR